MRPAIERGWGENGITPFMGKRFGKPVIRAEYINPFIESVKNFFDTMLACRAEREDEISINTNPPPPLDIIVLIGLSGYVRGNVAMAFPVKTALAMVSRIYQEDIVVVDSKVIDAVAEFINVIAGGAQAKLNTQLIAPIDISIPTVFRGNRFKMESHSKIAWIEIPFTSDLGPFVIRVSMNTYASHHKEDHHESPHR